MKKLSLFTIILISGIILNLSNVGALSLDELSDGSTEKNLTFISGENQTVYLNISKDSDIISAIINLKGITSFFNEAESVFCEGEFATGETGDNGCSVHYDGEWATQSIAGHGAGTIAKSGTSAFIYENFTIFSDDATLIWQANNLQWNTPGAAEPCYVYCWGAGEWVLLGSPILGNYVMAPYYNVFNLPFECLAQNILQIKYYLWSSVGYHNNNHCKSFEAAVHWTNANFSLEVGTPDGYYEWSQSGNFNTETTPDFSNEINQYLTNCEDDSGYCLVPLIFNVAAGEIEISNINITYTIDSDGDGIPNLDDECPNTPRGEEQLVYGCSCSQILGLKYGENNKKEVCSRGIVKLFIKRAGWAKDLFD